MSQAHTGCNWEKVLRDGPSLRWLVTKLVKLLKQEEFVDKFDGIAISGYSMSLLSPIVAYELGKDVCVVPKDGEKRNSPCLAEGKHSMRWLVIDDLICTGRTLKRVKKAVEEIDGTIAGVVFWHSNSGKTEIELESEKLDEYGSFMEWTCEKLPLWSAFHAQEMIEAEERQKAFS